MNTPRIIFMGTPEFALPSLNILHDNGYPIAAVVTAPDKPRGRGQEMLPTPVKRRALELGIPVLQPASLRDPAFAPELRALKPDIIVVVAFRILPKELFTIPPSGSFNLHASLLPRYRGAAPINRAVMAGEKETGVTTFFLEEKVDTGKMILQERVEIGDDDDAGAVHDRLMTVGADLVLRTVKLIERGEAYGVHQDDAHASPAPKILKEDCEIHWERSAGEIRNQIRGLSPTPGAVTMMHGKLLKVYRAKVCDPSCPDAEIFLVSSQEDREPLVSAPGTVAVAGETLYVQAGSGILELLEVQPEGKRRMTAAEFLRGYRVTTGEKMSAKPLSPASER